MEQENLFGEKIENNSLRQYFKELPFSVLDTRTASWLRRKKAWDKLGFESEIVRDAQAFRNEDFLKQKGKGGFINLKTISIFNPALCEVLYHWFCQKGGSIIDPFSGGSVRGIVANYMGYKYCGIDIRSEQIQSNVDQCGRIMGDKTHPIYFCGDAFDELLKFEPEVFDFAFSCPPYVNMEKYSDLPGDISNMNYEQFLPRYEEIIIRMCRLLKPGAFACFVVGEVRGPDGNYLGFVPDTVKAFQKAGMKFYNEAILLNSIASAPRRAQGNMKTNKLVKVHQNILVFKK